MAKVTSSSNRSKRKTTKPVTKSGGGKKGSARVTNASQRATTGSAKVTGSSRPALPPARKGGPIVRQETKPENPRRTSARARQAAAARGSSGGTRTGQPAGSANRTYGANVVNAAVRRAQRQSLMSTALRRGTVATSVASAILNAPEEFKKAQRLLKDPKGVLREVANRQGITMFNGKPKPKPKATSTKSRFAGARDAAIKKAKAIKGSPVVGPRKAASTTTTRRSSTAASTPTRRSSASTSTRRSSSVATKPKTKTPSTPKAPSAPSAPKQSVMSRQAQELRDMREASLLRQIEDLKRQKK